MMQSVLVIWRERPHPGHAVGMPFVSIPEVRHAKAAPQQGSRARGLHGLQNGMDMVGLGPGEGYGGGACPACLHFSFKASWSTPPLQEAIG